MILTLRTPRAVLANRKAQRDWYERQKTHTTTIYMILNKETADVYIGQTKNSLKKRMQQHRAAAKAGRGGALYESMREWGVDNFGITELYVCSEDECPKKEEARLIKEQFSEPNINLTVL